VRGAASWLAYHARPPRIRGSNYRTGQDAIVIAEVFAKKTPQTPKAILKAARRRLREYDDA